MRSPRDIKSLLIQAAGTSSSWNEVVKQAVESSWAPFRERVVSQIEVKEEMQSDQSMKINQVKDVVTRKKFCHCMVMGSTQQ